MPFAYLFFLLNVPVNSYGHVEMVTYLTTLLFPVQALSKQLIRTKCTYFRLLLTTVLLEAAEGGV